MKLINIVDTNDKILAKRQELIKESIIRTNELLKLNNELDILQKQIEHFKEENRIHEKEKQLRKLTEEINKLESYYYFDFLISLLKLYEFALNELNLNLRKVLINYLKTKEIQLSEDSFNFDSRLEFNEIEIIKLSTNSITIEYKNFEPINLITFKYFTDGDLQSFIEDLYNQMYICYLYLKVSEVWESTTSQFKHRLICKTLSKYQVYYGFNSYLTNEPEMIYLTETTSEFTLANKSGVMLLEIKNKENIEETVSSIKQELEVFENSEDLEQKYEEYLKLKEIFESTDL